jgi:hypothetical protein
MPGLKYSQAKDGSKVSLKNPDAPKKKAKKAKKKTKKKAEK